MLLPALVLGLVLVMLSVAGQRLPEWRAWFDGPERGTWRAVTIDGLDVSDERMHIVVAEGEIRGGRDGCNYWGYSSEPDPQTGERMTTTTLAACPDTPKLRAYDAIGHFRSDLRLLAEDRLEVSYRGTTGIFRRWTEELEEAEREADERAMEAARRAQPEFPSPVYPPPGDRPPPPPAPPPAPPMPPAPPPPAPAE
ncbi:hypothetical protein [Erythrobacter alti]|uniref:hypothetical protein n=1 Tax=Erythrobacter alti TaxID=1896145 RepID=UPI0030F42079